MTDLIVTVLAQNRQIKSVIKLGAKGYVPSKVSFWAGSSELIITNGAQIKLLCVQRSIKGGGGVHPDFFVKLYFKIAVDQQTRAHIQTFEGVPDFGCPPVPAGQPRPYLVNFAKSP